MLKVGNALRTHSLGAIPCLHIPTAPACLRHKHTDTYRHKHTDTARHKHTDTVTQPVSKTPPVLLNFQDARSAYESKNTLELIRSRIVLRLCGNDFIVNNNERLMKVAKMILPNIAFNFLMRMTFYGQFVGGADVHDLKPKLAKMQEFGVKPILDYSVEADLKEDSADEVPEMIVTEHRFKQDTISAKRQSHKPVARTYPYKGEENCEENMKIFLECLETASKVCDENAFCAIKVTALTKPNALLEGSQFLWRIKELFHEHSETFEDTIPQFINCIHLPKDVLGPKVLTVQKRMTYDNFKGMLTVIRADLPDDEISDLFNQMAPDELGRVKFHRFRELCQAGPPAKPLYSLLINSKKSDGSFMLNSMNDNHLDAINRLEDRLVQLCDRAVELDAKILVDAEQTYFQPMIDFLANKLMARYNKEKAYVFNTYQCYLKDTPSQMIYDADKANLLGYILGVKLVRGAYMDQERQRALDLNYTDPIYPDKAYTNSCYINMFELLLKQIENEKCEAMIASHNEFSIQYVVEKMRQCDIDPRNGGIYFGQLLGMCDQVTYLLGAGGYSSYKYVPYGPIEAVLPYLSRRAYENKGMLQGSQKEIELLKGELRRRKWGLF